jgi:hypothetical protein
MKIYSLTGSSVPVGVRAKDYSASGAFREVVQLLIDLSAAAEAALIHGAVSSNQDLPPGARAVPLSTSKGILWVHANLTRQLAEKYVVELLDRLPSGSAVEFRRAGELVWPH